MSNDDPKTPLDAVPSETPELLHKELSLDRRSARAPTFEELRARPEPTADSARARPPLAPPPAHAVPTRTNQPSAAPRAPAAPPRYAPPAQRGAIPPSADHDEPATVIAQVNLPAESPTSAPVEGPTQVAQLMPQPEPTRLVQPPRASLAPSRTTDTSQPIPRVQVPGARPAAQALRPPASQPFPAGLTPRPGPSAHTPLVQPLRQAPTAPLETVARPLPAAPLSARPGLTNPSGAPVSTPHVGSLGPEHYRRAGEASVPAQRPQPVRSSPSSPPVDPANISATRLTARPADQAAPPSPTDWAELQKKGGPPSMPLITPAEPALGGSVPPGQTLRPRTEARASAPLQRPQQPVAPAESLPPSVEPVVPQVKTAPPPARAAPVHRASSQPLEVASIAQAEPPPQGIVPALGLPAHMLVTQPGAPGPYAKRPPLPTPLPELEDSAPPAHPSLPGPRPSQSPSANAEVDGPELAKATTDSTVLAAPAGLLRRLLAWTVDLSIIGLLAAFFLSGAVLVIAPKGLSVTRGLLAIALPALLLGCVLAFVYTTIFAFLFKGKTPGRRLAGIRLVDGTGSVPGPGRALLRASLSLVSFGLFLSGFWMGLFDRRGQTFHDKLARTFVVRFLDTSRS